MICCHSRHLFKVFFLCLNFFIFFKVNFTLISNQTMCASVLSLNSTAKTLTLRKRLLMTSDADVLDYEQIRFITELFLIYIFLPPSPPIHICANPGK